MYFSIVLMLATKNDVSFDQRLFIYYQIDSVPDFIISKPEKKIVTKKEKRNLKKSILDYR